MTDLAAYQDPLVIQRLLHTSNTIAVVGLSSNELRASYFVGYYLKRHGYRVIPVNPRETHILGETCYPRLQDVPVPIDIVNVFRAPDALPGIARDAVAVHAGALWCQFGVINEEGARIAEDGGLTGHGPLHQGRARSVHRPDALARFQYASHHVGADRAPVASARNFLRGVGRPPYDLTLRGTSTPKRRPGLQSGVKNIAVRTVTLPSSAPRVPRPAPACGRRDRKFQPNRSNAWLRSPSRSVMVSIPTDRRRRAGHGQCRSFIRAFLRCAADGWPNLATYRP